MQDNFLYQNYADSQNIMSELETALQSEPIEQILTRLQIKEYITAQNLKDNTNYQISLFRQSGQASIEGLEMVSVTGSKYFLHKVTEESLRLLYTFPEVERTFRLL